MQPRATDSGLRAPATPLRAAPPAAGPRQVGESPRQGRKPFRDNPTLLLVGIALLVAAFVALIVLARSTTSFSPDFLTEVVLYALSVADLTMLVALVFVLARNIIKLVVERRRALPFARFRAKLVAVLLGLTLVPSILVLLVGSELIRNSADRWFNAPMDEILSSANRIASDYYAERQRSVVVQLLRVSREPTPGLLRHLVLVLEAFHRGARAGLDGRRRRLVVPERLHLGLPGLGRPGRRRGWWR